MGIRLGLAVLLTMLTIAASPEPAPAAPGWRLVSHGGIHEPLVVEACRSAHGCVEWTRYSGEPPRRLVDTGFSRSGIYFYLWSRAEGRPRDLDFFEVPEAGQRARRIGHVQPGYGGELRWLANDFLWHTWGCGAPCAAGALYDSAGRRIASELGSMILEAPDDRRVAVLELGPIVVMLETTPSGVIRREFKSDTHSWFPSNTVWTANGLTLEYDSETLHCVPEADRLQCIPQRSASDAPKR